MTDALNVPLIITISSTVVGTAAGAVGGYFFAKHKLTKDFEAELQKEIASVRKTFREHQDEKLILSGDEDGISLVAQPIVVVTEEETVIISPEETDEYQEKIIDLQYSREEEKQDALQTVRTEDTPYVISVAEYHDEFDEHDKTVLRYYEGDNILAGEDDVVIHNEEDVVSTLALTKFGERSQDRDIVYVRNEKLGVDFEISRNKKSYTEAVLGMVEKNGKTRKIRDSE